MTPRMKELLRAFAYDVRSLKSPLSIEWIDENSVTLSEAVEICEAVYHAVKFYIYMKSELTAELVLRMQSVESRMETKGFYPPKCASGGQESGE